MDRPEDGVSGGIDKVIDVVAAAVSGGIDKVIDVVAAGVSGGIDKVIDVVGAGGGAAVAGAGAGGAVLLVGTGGGVGGGVDVVAVALAGSAEPGVVDPVVVEALVVDVVVPAGGCVEPSVDDATVVAGEPLSEALSVVDVDVAEPVEGAVELELVSPVVVWPEVAGAVDCVVSVEPAVAAAGADVPSSAAAGCAIASAVPTVHNAASSKRALHELPDLVPAPPVTAPAPGNLFLGRAPSYQSAKLDTTVKGAGPRNDKGPAARVRRAVSHAVRRRTLRRKHPVCRFVENLVCRFVENGGTMPTSGPGASTGAVCQSVIQR